MKDFNTITLNGLNYSLKDIDKQLIINNLEKDIVLFIKQWINDKNYVELKTSGSTGKPKTIKISKEKMLASAAMTCSFFKLDETKTALLCMSAKHIGGIMMIVRAIYAKMNLIVVTPNANPLEDIVHIIDFTAMVPYQVQVSLDKNLTKLKSVKQLIIGGGVIPFHLEEQLIKEQINAYHTFGMTETISHFALRDIRSSDFFTCLPNITVANKQDGSLIINASALFTEPIYTNDIVEIKDSKNFKWLGRKDFAIESGGLKIHPEQVEKALAPFIKTRFFISSLPHIELNNQLILVLEGSEYNLDNSIFNHLEKYHKPKQVYFVHSFVETKSGKVNRSATLNKLNKKGS